MKHRLLQGLAVFLGLMVGALLNGGILHLGAHLVPPPAGVDATSPAGLKAGIHLYGVKHFLFPWLAHAGGTLAGAWVASFLASRLVPTAREALAWIVGAIYLAGGIAMCVMVPAPLWFMAVDLLGAYLPMAWLALRLVPRRA